MNKSFIIRSLIDGGMVALMVLLMAFERIGRTAHEWLGLGLFLLFALHHFLNRRWLQRALYPSPLSVSWRSKRTLRLGVTALFALCMLGMIVSAVLISRSVFGFLPVGGALGFGRRLHMLSVNWGFLVAGLHLGVHWQMFLNQWKRRFPFLAGVWMSVVGAAIALYGFVAFWQSGMSDDLFLRNEFAFYDYSEPLGLFLLNRLGIFALFVWLGHRLARRGDSAGSARRQPRRP